MGLKGFDGRDKKKTLDAAIRQLLDGDISAATRETLLRQIEKPLPDVTSPNEPDDTLVADNMRAGQQGARGRQARLLNPTGDPEVFKIVSLVLGSPEFQRQ